MSRTATSPPTAPLLPLLAAGALLGRTREAPFTVIEEIVSGDTVPPWQEVVVDFGRFDDLDTIALLAQLQVVLPARLGEETELVRLSFGEPLLPHPHLLLTVLPPSDIERRRARQPGQEESLPRALAAVGRRLALGELLAALPKGARVGLGDLVIDLGSGLLATEARLGQPYSATALRRLGGELLGLVMALEHGGPVAPNVLDDLAVECARWRQFFVRLDAARSFL